MLVFQRDLPVRDRPFVPTTSAEELLALLEAQRHHLLSLTSVAFARSTIALPCLVVSLLGGGDFVDAFAIDFLRLSHRKSSKLARES
jgi:hypothetical protein